MASFKSALFVAIVSFGVFSIQPAAGQDNVALNLWLDVAQSLTEDTLTEIGKIPPPTIQIPAILPRPAQPAQPCPPAAQPVIISAPAPVPAIPAVPAPPAPAPVQPSLPQQIYYYLVQSGNSPSGSPVVIQARPPPSTPAPTAAPTAAPTPAPPATTAAPCGPCGPKPCEPEKVRIVVVSDCDDKPSKSSESESSEETKVIIPVRSSKRAHHYRN
jgi:hypothetical protein